MVNKIYAKMMKIADVDVDVMMIMVVMINVVVKRKNAKNLVVTLVIKLLILYMEWINQLKLSSMM